MFYTSIIVSKGVVYHFYRDGNSRYMQTDSAFCPSAFVEDPLGTYTDVYSNTKVSSKRFKNIYDYGNASREKQHLYHDIDAKYQFIRSIYGSGLINYNFNDIVWANLDIENPTPRENGFPSPEEAKFPIRVLTMFVTKGDVVVKHVFGDNAYQVEGDEIYYHCADEQDLLEKFVKVWQSDFPDIVTGWNIDNFDIPYLIRRLELYGLSAGLSPIGIVRTNPNENYERMKNMKSGFRYNPKFYSTIAGTEVLDYYWLYRKYKAANMESFKLSFIGEAELGLSKIDYEEHTDIYAFYCNDYQKFVRYNIRDVEIVQKLNEKLKYLRLQTMVAYLAHVNYKDVFSPVKTWEVYLYNILLDNHYVLPYKRQHFGAEYVGAWTMHIDPGFYQWIVAHDLDSLYPHVMMQYNMSFEKYRGMIYDILNVSPRLSVDAVDERLLDKSLDLSILKERNLTMAANGALFDMTEEGIMPKILSQIYATRKTVKREMLALEQQYENTKDPALINEIASRDSYQHALKIFLNSYYGIIGNEAFVLYDVNIAAAVTLSAQLSTRWIVNYVTKHVDPKYGFKIVYGDTDSVTGEANITILTDYVMADMTINDFFEAVCLNGEVIGNDGCKTIISPKFKVSVLSFNPQTKTNEFKSVKYVMRKQDSVKPLIRVSCYGKHVDMTIDHSLIVKEKASGEFVEVSPLDVRADQLELVIST